MSSHRPAPRPDAAPPRPMLVRSPALARVVSEAERAAPTGCPVLILGERGVGKELLAQVLHQASGRRGAVIAVNCATIQPALVESTLFGYARGAFTGAVAPSSGLVRQASGGTLFLDEVGELPLEVQARLLRLLQEGVVQPVGEREQKVDVRIVAATNRDLDAEVAAGRFRADLRDRLHMVALRVPPLRERRAEILPLAEHFLATARELDGRARPALSAGAKTALRAYAWPGNVRELRNVVLGAAILGQGGALTAQQVRAGFTEASPARAVTRPVASLELLQPGRRYTMGELVDALGLPRGTVKTRVAAWVKAGGLVVVDPGRRQSYRLAAAVPPAGGDVGVVPGVPGRVLAWLRARGPASTGALALALEVPLTSLKRAVQGLLASGRVVVSGVGRASRVALVAGTEDAGASEALALPQDQDVRSAGRAAVGSGRPPPRGEGAEAPARLGPALADGLAAGRARPTPTTATERRAAQQSALALRLVAQEGVTTARVVAAALGQGVRTAERVLARLVADGRLRSEGYARARRYLSAPSVTPTPADARVRPARSPSPRPRSVASPPQPALTLYGQPLPPDLLRVAVLLAASPAGVSAPGLAGRCALPESDATRLLHALGAAGLLSASPDPQPRWRLSSGEGVGMPDPG